MRIATLLLLLAGFALAQEPSIEALIRKLGDRDYDQREPAQQTLQARGEVIRLALTRALEDSPDAEVRKRAGEILAELDGRAERRAINEKLTDLKHLTTPTFDPKTLRPLVEKKGEITD